MIKVSYQYPGHPQTNLFVFLKTQEQVDAFKKKYSNYIFM
jgi:hypothetical protein